MAFFTHSPNMIPLMSEEGTVGLDEPSIVGAILKVTPASSYTTNTANPRDLKGNLVTISHSSPTTCPQISVNLNSTPVSTTTDINFNPSEVGRRLPPTIVTETTCRINTTTTTPSCGNPEKTDYAHEAITNSTSHHGSQVTPTTAESNKGIVGKSRIEYVVHL